MAKRPRHAEVADAIHLLMQSAPHVFVSMLVNHGTECICHRSARALMEFAGLSVDQLCEAYVDSILP